MEPKLSNINQVMRVSEYLSADNTSFGMRLIEIDNGIIRCLINLDRAMDIYSLAYKGTNISYLSKLGLNKKNEKFKERFEGGMLYTCGLEEIGQRSSENMQHGSIHLQSAQLMEKIVNEDNIIVRGRITQTDFFGIHLILERTIKLNKSSSSIEINDQLINPIKKEQPYVLLYHFNLGYPFLDENVKIKIKSKKVQGLTPYATKNIDKISRFDDATHLEEQVFYHFDNKEAVIVKNEKLKKQFILEYDSSAFPYLLQWKCQIENEYALGIEPATSLFNECFKYSIIKGEETLKFTFKIEVIEY